MESSEWGMVHPQLAQNRTSVSPSIDMGPGISTLRSIFCSNRGTAALEMSSRASPCVPRNPDNEGKGVER